MEFGRELDLVVVLFRQFRLYTTFSPLVGNMSAPNL